MNDIKIIRISEDVHTRIVGVSKETGIPVKWLAERFLLEGIDRFGVEYKALFLQ